MVIPFHCNPALAVTTVHKLRCKMRGVTDLADGAIKGGIGKGM